MAYVPNSNSVVAFQGTVPWSVLGNGQSVSGTVNVGNFPTNQNVSGSVVTFQGTSPWIVTGSVQAQVTPAANQSVSGTVQADIRGSVATIIIGGSIAASFTPPVNQSVSGTVNVGNFPTNQNVSGSVVSFQGTNPWIVTGSVQASITPAANQSVSGTVGASVIGTVPVTQGGTWIASVFGNMSVLGTVPVTQSGAWSTSVVGTVGASVIGLTPVSVSNFPTNQNVSGSVVAFQGGTQITSIVGAYAEDSAHTDGNIGLFALGVRNDTVSSFVSANTDYAPLATDSAGRTLTKPFAPEEARIEGYNSVVSASVTTLVAAAGTGLKNYVTDVMIANTGATTTLVTFKSGGGTSILGYTIAPAGGGSNMTFQTPIRTLANETFDFQATTSTSVLFATVKGYKAP